MSPIQVDDREAMSNPPLQAGTAPATVQETGFSILYSEENAMRRMVVLSLDAMFDRDLACYAEDSFLSRWLREAAVCTQV